MHIPIVMISSDLIKTGTRRPKFRHAAASSSQTGLDTCSQRQLVAALLELSPMFEDSLLSAIHGYQKAPVRQDRLLGSSS